MGIPQRWSLALLLALLTCLTGSVVVEASPPTAYGKLPLSFEANHGQTDPSVRFVARSTGYQLFLAQDEAVLVLRRPGALTTDTLRMTLIDAASARPDGVDRLAGSVNYLLGNDPAKWRTEIPLYAKVLTRGVYPGIDLVYYGNQRQLEYDFLVAPGADPAAIRLAFQGLATPAGQRALALDPSGDLTLRVRGGDVVLKRPVAYQHDANGQRKPVDVAFALVPAPNAAGTWHVGFKVGVYDRQRPLVIDPVLSYATYLGGGDVDSGMAIAVLNGEAYVTGYTESLNFPGTAAQGNQPLRDAFVAKLNASGSALVYATYLGGDGADAGMGIAVDSSGQAYVTGFTESTNFPTVPVTPLFGNQGGRDAFVTKLNAAGNGFVYSTYLGGGADDTGLGIAVDTAGNAYVTGWTDSTDFPTTASAFQTDQPDRDAFVTKINSTGTALVYSTYLGGSGIDEGQAIAVDATGLAYVTGDTTSTNLPTTANTRTPGGGQDAFVAKLDPGASGAASRLFLTYFGGSGADAGRGIAVDSLGFIHIAGVTSSTNLPTKIPFQGSYGGGASDAFVAKLNAAGTGPNTVLMYASYLGGSGDDAGHAIALDTEDQAFITGFTTSGNFPMFHAMDTSLGGTKDAFVAKFDPAEIGAPSLRYSTYLGGSGEDEGYGIAVDASGSAYVVGLTRSGDFPSAVGSLSGPEDAFVAKLSEPDLVVSTLTVPAAAGEGEQITITDTTRNNGSVTAAASTTGFYLSTDNKLSANDTFLGSRAVPELGAGEESTVDTQLTLPTPLTPGTYFLFAKADDEDAIGESFESNNKTKKTINIGSDLSVTAVTVSSSGLTLTITDTTKNIGGAAIAVSTATKFVLVTPSGEVPLGSRTVGPLTAGQESTTSTDVQIPANTTTGTYTVAVRADADGAVTETSETNNEKTASLAVGIDLVVSALTVPGSAGAGATVSVTPTIQNKGAITAPASTTEFFLSKTNTIDASAVSIGTQAAPELAPGATSAVAASVTIPSNTTAGSYFIIAKANNVAPLATETNANNNTRARTSVIGPDLTISFVSPSSATSGPGKTVTIKDSTKNIGAGTALASTTKFFFSTDAIWDPTDTELGQRSVPQLTPGTDNFNSTGVVLTIPTGTAAGSYFIIVKANAGATPIGETNTTNNTSSIPVTVVGADLVVSSLTVSVGAGGSLSITDITKNQGTATAGASITRFHFSTDGTFDEATDPVLGERNVGQLAAGASSEATTTLSLPAGTAPGSYTIFARADATGLVAESDESNNRRARAIDTRGSDLTIPSLSFKFGTGASLDVTDTTRNEGPATVGASTTAFYVSTDAAFGPGDAQIGTRAVVSLAAGDQNTTVTTLSIPPTIAPGDYFLIARANAGTPPIGETNDANNTASTPISIKADLVVESLTIPATAAAGATVTATGTIANNGRIPASAQVVKLFLSVDATVDGTDTLLGSQAFGALGVLKTADFSIPFTVPDVAGPFFVIAKVDADNQVPESNEANNTRAKTLGVGVDLNISDFSGVPTASGAGSTFTVNDVTKNLSSVPVGESTTSFYLSTDNVFDPADVLLASRTVPALGARRTHGANTSVTIPVGTTSGNYFIIAVADAGKVYTEANENNNTSARPIVIGSDLVITAVGAPASAGFNGQITVTDTTFNKGGSQAGLSTTKFFLSLNTTFEAGTDTLLGSRAVGTLNGNTGSNGSTPLTIPSGTAAGTYYVIAVADADGAVNEVDETNNASASGPILIGPDLVISAMSAPLTTSPGATINISNTIVNQGGAPTTVETIVKFFLSADTIIDGNDVFLGSRTVPALIAGNGNPATTPVIIPADTPSGIFFIIGQADATGLVTEVNEANNTFNVTIKTAPDLQVTVLNAPSEAASGASITIKDTTKNQGAAVTVSTTTRFFFSTDDILDASDTPLGSRTVPPLAFGAASIGSGVVVTLPAGLTAGSYFILAQADATNAVTEALEDNNVRAHAITIGPDYTISAVTAPSAGGAGLPLTIGASTKNLGADGAKTITQFFLSGDDILDPGDKLIGSRDVPALAAGAINTGSITITLPTNVTPGSYFIIAKANGDGAVSETSTTNNTKARAIIIGPDLVVSALTTPNNVGAAIPFSVTDTTRNDGAGATTESTTSFYLSTDFTLDAPDILIGSRTVPGLAPGATSTTNTTLTIPDGTPGGTYFIIARANDTSSVAEIDGNNNTRFKQVKVGPDLLISTLTGPTSATAGSTITLTDTTTNVGAGRAGAFTIRVYLSADENLDVGIDPEVGSRTVTSGLAPGAANSGPITVTIPTGISGAFVLIAVADADNAVSELNETNNNKQKSLNVLP